MHCWRRPCRILVSFDWVVIDCTNNLFYFVNQYIDCKFRLVDSEDEELKAIGHEHQQRTVEKVLNLAITNNNTVLDESSPTKDRVVQHQGSLEMLTRVFPFHAKSAIESSLETCGGDIAKAVQQLVGRQASSPTLSVTDEEAVAMPKNNRSFPSSSKSAFLPTGLPSLPTSTSDQSRPHYSQVVTAQTPSTPSLSLPSPTNLAAYPPALRMMPPYSPAGMMPFLHPSAYFAAAASAAAAAANPHSYPWLFSGSYSNARPLVQQHLCLPDCSVCPPPTGTSSTSSSSSPGESGNNINMKASALLIASQDDLFKGISRKDVFHQGGSSNKHWISDLFLFPIE